MASPIPVSGSSLVLLLILSTLMLPLEVTLVPTFLIVHKFESMIPYQGIVAPLLIDAFGVFLMRQSIISIPSDYIEAARIDGAGELRILLQIVVRMPAGAFGARDLLVSRQLGPVLSLTVVSMILFAPIPLVSFDSAEDTATRPPGRMAIACSPPSRSSCCS